MTEQDRFQEMLNCVATTLESIQSLMHIPVIQALADFIESQAAYAIKQETIITEQRRLINLLKNALLEKEHGRGKYIVKELLGEDDEHEV